MKFIKLILVGLVLVMGHSTVAQERVITPSATKTKAQLQIEQMLANKTGVLPGTKQRGPATVILETDSRFKTLNQLPASFQRYLDPNYKRNDQALVIDTDAAAKDPIVARRNQQLLKYISVKKKQ